jgi:hypothetical protein
MKRYPYSLFFLSLLVFCSGCIAAAVVAGAGAGVGTYSYMNRELTATYNEPLNEIWPKTLSAVKKLQLTFRKKEIDALGGTIEVRRSDGTLIKIRLTPMGDRDTSIGVRVGTWGDREKSELVHKAIRKEL